MPVISWSAPPSADERTNGERHLYGFLRRQDRFEERRWFSGPRDTQEVTGPGHRDIEQLPLTRERVVAILRIDGSFHKAGARQHVGARVGDEHCLELQALRAVHRPDLNSTWHRLLVVETGGGNSLTGQLGLDLVRSLRGPREHRDLVEGQSLRAALLDPAKRIGELIGAVSKASESWSRALHQAARARAI